ncbi:MAG TPA: PDZ domain-containing protein [Longimicrobium sp.]|nr:PDZ domain-containing protein [Longimicrobium sp.]
MPRILCALAVLAAVAAHPARGSAQEAVTAPGRPSVIEFSYGWNGGITLGPGGKARVASYPRVVTVAPSSPAAAAGLRAGDMIVSVDGRDGMSTPLFENVRAGRAVVLRIRRGDEEREIRFVPRALPRR